MAIEHTFNSANERNLLRPLRVYFAGKVRAKAKDYRAAIFNDSRIMSREVGSENPVFHGLFKGRFGTVLYGGPSALSCDHGCWHDEDHGISSAYRQQEEKMGITNSEYIPVYANDPDELQPSNSCPDGSNGLSRGQALARCLHQIRSCDALYAYIDSPDCHGTLCEIGYAHALGIPIYIVFCPRLANSSDEDDCWHEPGHGYCFNGRESRNDFWFAAEMATKCAWGAPCELLEHIAFNAQNDIFSRLKKSRAKVRPKDRVAVLVRDNYTCKMCGVSRSNGAVLEIDHVHPVSKGGSNELSNLQVLCRECNAGKSNHVLPMP